MSDVYNSSYTGTQIDSAVGSVLNKESTWDGKQNKLTGQQGQVVGFDSTGNAVAQDNPGGGLPTGGTPGQMLYQGESGAEWGDKPVMLLKFTDTTGLTPGPLNAPDKTPVEIAKALTEEGFAVVAELTMISGVEENIFYGYPAICQYYEDVPAAQVIICINYMPDTLIVITGAERSDDEITWELSYDSASASRVKFSNYNTSFTATNVQDAIEEVNEKIPTKPQSVTVTLTAAGWSSNTQTVTVQGVETSGQSVRISPATKTDADNWVAAGVWCSEPTTANQLVFTCDTAPTENININVELQEVQS